jgi:cytochrome P450
MSSTLPVSDVDIWSDANILDPFPTYRELRDLGPVVHLQRYDLYAVTRYDDVKTVLEDWRTFSSALGVTFSEGMNSVVAGSLIGSDPPLHQHFRAILERPLTPVALRQVRERIKVLAEETVADALGRAHVEAVSDISSSIPVSLVAELVGLPPEGRERMLAWASGAFNAIAPEGVARVEEGVAQMGDMLDYFRDPTLPARLRAGGWAAQLRDAAERGEIDWEQFCVLLQNYVLPALDTTIHAISSMLWLLAGDPETWAMLRSDRALVGRAVHEALRLEGPVQAFSRLTTADTELGGSPVAAGKRLFVCFASANRDERHYADPDRFDVRRDATDHLAFGIQEHSCLGRSLAALEMTMVLTALVERVERLSLVGMRREMNNSLRGLKRLDLTLQAASSNGEDKE